MEQYSWFQKLICIPPTCMFLYAIGLSVPQVEGVMIDLVQSMKSLTTPHYLWAMIKCITALAFVIVEYYRGRRRAERVRRLIYVVICMWCSWCIGLILFFENRSTFRSEDLIDHINLIYMYFSYHGSRLLNEIRDICDFVDVFVATILVYASQHARSSNGQLILLLTLFSSAYFICYSLLIIVRGEPRTPEELRIDQQAQRIRELERQYAEVLNENQLNAMRIEELEQNAIDQEQEILELRALVPMDNQLVDQQD